jgi:hypothetical protein
MASTPLIPQTNFQVLSILLVFLCLTKSGPPLESLVSDLEIFSLETKSPIIYLTNC